MKKKQRKALALSRETLVHLQDDAVAAAKGGVFTHTCLTCVDTCGTSCIISNCGPCETLNCPPDK